MSKTEPCFQGACGPAGERSYNHTSQRGVLTELGTGCSRKPETDCSGWRSWGAGRSSHGQNCYPVTGVGHPVKGSSKYEVTGIWDSLTCCENYMWLSMIGVVGN